MRVSGPIEAWQISQRHGPKFLIFGDLHKEPAELCTDCAPPECIPITNFLLQAVRTADRLKKGVLFLVEAPGSEANKAFIRGWRKGQTIHSPSVVLFNVWIALKKVSKSRKSKPSRIVWVDVRHVPPLCDLLKIGYYFDNLVRRTSKMLIVDPKFTKVLSYFHSLDCLKQFCDEISFEGVQTPKRRGDLGEKIHESAGMIVADTFKSLSHEQQQEVKDANYLWWHMFSAKYQKNWKRAVSGVLAGEVKAHSATIANTIYLISSIHMDVYVLCVILSMSPKYHEVIMYLGNHHSQRISSWFISKGARLVKHSPEKVNHQGKTIHCVTL